MFDSLSLSLSLSLGTGVFGAAALRPTDSIDRNKRDTRQNTQGKRKIKEKKTGDK